MLSVNQIVELAKGATPAYLFDLDELSERLNRIRQILGPDIRLCYAMKANPFLVDAMKGLAVQFEVCSPGEFAICEREKVDMDRIVLSGVNKEKSDIEHVMEDCGGVHRYTVESMSQLVLLSQCAVQRKQKIQVLLRLTSGNQFGLDEAVLTEIVADRDAHAWIEITGIQCYTGTQKKKLSVIADELRLLEALCDRLSEQYGFVVRELEYGPGLPVHYFGEDAGRNDFELLKEFARLLEPLRDKYKITLEMGRYLAATCGVYVSAVADTKINQGQRYCIIDGGIHHINYYGQAMAMKVPAFSYVRADGTVCAGKGAETTADSSPAGTEKWTICGSLCTVGDVIVKNLPVSRPAPGDLLIFYNIGAYSVTEGIYLFLSRKLPRIMAFSEKNGLQVYREPADTGRINSRTGLL